MKGDFSRLTFDPRRQFARVLMQQGRVLLDADWNEQTAILLHYMRALAADLIGPHGGPADNLGFEITVEADVKSDFRIGSGHYYVDGLLCESDGLPYSRQPCVARGALKEGPYLAYLDVWERVITYLEDRDVKEGNIREVALGGPDTSARSQVVWGVKLGAEVTTKPGANKFLNDLSLRVKPLLRARAYVPQAATEPCTIQPDSRYRGAENQLYRVEIHDAGDTDTQTATFKWSRENGSVVFPIVDLAPGEGSARVTLAHLGRDGRSGLEMGNWVEIVDDEYTLQNRAEPLLLVKDIDPDRAEVTLSGPRESHVGEDANRHPFLRRWDHVAGDPRRGGLKVDDKGCASVVEGVGEDGWLMLENGVQIQFQKFEAGKPQPKYQSGDYWLIPARTATGDIEWPWKRDATTGELERDGSHNPIRDDRPPVAVEHHYAPLWLINVAADGSVTADEKNDIRLTFKKLVAK